MENPMDVSVLLITYNHARFLEQAIRSVLNQQTRFSWELVIGDDASSDGAREILSRYAADPRIRVLPNHERLGMNPNFVRTLHACTGRYVALLDGDDYWIDPGKLERQISLLERRPDIAICATNGLLHREDLGGLQIEHQYAYEERMFHTADLVPTNPCQTSTCVVRRSAIPVIDEDLMRLGMLDFPIWILASRHGALCKLPVITAAYRIHQQGVWSSTSKRAQLTRIIEMLTWVERKFERPELKRAIARSRLQLASREILLAREEGDNRGLSHRCRQILSTPLRYGLLPRARAQALSTLVFSLRRKPAAPGVDN
jgi:glycosyltransferase involved in cell wall biosynthesis